MNNVREIERLNALELRQGLCAGYGASWHDQYRNSAWIFVGGLAGELTEGDIICVFSQFGEVDDVNLVRDEEGKSRRFAFLKYEDQRSAVLAVDNLNGALVAGLTVRVDHVEKYNPPKRARAEAAEGGGALGERRGEGGPISGRARDGGDCGAHEDAALLDAAWDGPRRTSPHEEWADAKRRKMEKKERKERKKEKKERKKEKKERKKEKKEKKDRGRAEAAAAHTGGGA